MYGESRLDGWRDIPIRITVVGKVKEVMPNRRAALVEVSGVQFVASFGPQALESVAVGADVLIDEECASIIGSAPNPGNGRAP